VSELLLQTISTLGRMNLDKFYGVFNALCQLSGISSGEDDLNYVRRQTIRHLDSLGHCEFDFEKREVFVCPPALVTLPVCGLPKAVLTGARIPSLVRNIKDFVKSNRDAVSYSIIPQKRGYFLLPSAFIIEATDYDYLKNVSLAAQIDCQLTPPAAWSLVNFSAGIENAKNNLQYENRADLNWEKQTFSTDTLTFSWNHSTEKYQRLVSYTNPVNQQRYHLIWNGNQAAEVDRDWGRYIILSSEGVDVIFYDERSQRLAVPSTVPLPRLLARAAALCTGLAPSPAYTGEKSKGGLPAGHPVDIYSAVPPPAARMISKKLSQNLIKYTIIPDSNGVI